jgi:hypothetical protein
MKLLATIAESARFAPLKNTPPALNRDAVRIAPVH